MKTSTRARIALASALVLLLGPTTSALARQPARSSAESDLYIVRLTERPLALYAGGVAGIPATNPRARGETKLDTSSAASVAYLRHLRARQAAFEAALASATGHAADVVFRYRYALNGVAVRLTPAQAAIAERLPGVASVQRSFERRIQTDAGPEWIGAPGVWSGDATANGAGTKGEGVVVGVIDTGVNHDHPSFAEEAGDGYEHDNPRGRFYGLCDPATGAPFCNDKLIGVHDFTGTTPLDDNGHGSHTASTAAGNAHAAKLNAPTVTIERQISGVAPHANLITYKACLATGSCASPSLVAAIDQATADGVDVVNYSIGGGSNDPWSDADSLAFLGAREAGVFVAVSAGNSGPRPETVGSPADAPWVLGVAASTHNRAFVTGLVDMAGGTAAPTDMTGKSVTSGVGPASIVHAESFGDRQCLRPFAPGTFDGEIVVCDRGVNPRVEKGRNVKIGGAGGMVLANTAAEGESVTADPHELPAVHVGFRDGEALRTWLADGAGHRATITGTTTRVDDSLGDVTAGFSSRGPNRSVPDVLKPDVTAPGVDILAAVNTTSPTEPPEYATLSGTSMSSPHAAGSAALVRALHPEWTAAQVHSALVTTGVTESVRKDDGVRPADPFDMGGGRIDLRAVAAAGLVLDETAEAFAAADPDEEGDPAGLNLATLASASCKGSCRWTRTVENPLRKAVTWKASASRGNSLPLEVSPSSFTVQPGGTQVITVEADVATLPVGKTLFGEIVLRSTAAPDARLPVAVRTGGEPHEVNVEANATSGSARVGGIKAATDATGLVSQVSGLAEGSVSQHSVEQDPTPLSPYDSDLGTATVSVNVPRGARILTARVTETTATDVDLYVGKDADQDGKADPAEQVCSSASEIALESCTLRDPAGGPYWVRVQNWLSGRARDTIRLEVAVVPGTDNRNLTVETPPAVTAGEGFAVTLSWDEPRLEQGDAWFALVELGSQRRRPGDIATLLVRVRRPHGA